MTDSREAAATAVRRNYSRVGVAVIQHMYGSPGFLSPAGPQVTERLMAAARIDASSRVLDVGCGVGGPAMYVATRLGCAVTGVDLLERSVSRATVQARAAHLDPLPEFLVADACVLPLAAACVDVVVSQDALCHVPGRDRALLEAARVLAAGGRLAVADWVLTGRKDARFTDEVLPALAAPSLATARDYVGFARAAGLVDVSVEAFDDLADEYAGIVRDVERGEAELVATFGADVFATVLEKNRTIARSFADGQIGRALCVGRKPPG